ncbi:hypothetical protein [Catenibacterium sp.]|uniref:hypothetical protein n=1 Tax=Catenibacterium sp. TaxID=2049022 RepID=UPI00399252F3
MFTRISLLATIGIFNKAFYYYRIHPETFSTLNPDLLNLKQWLINHKCFDACMESTGKYWIPIFSILEDEINICQLIQNMSKQLKGRRLTRKIQNGSVIYLNMI